MTKAYTYRIENTITGQFYIGVRYANIRKKLSYAEDTEYWGSSSHLAKAMEVEPNGWRKVLIAEYPSIDEATAAEPILIAEHLGNTFCLNVSPSGSFWYSFTDRTERHAKGVATRLSNGTYKQSDAAKAAVSAAQKGRTKSAREIQRCADARRGKSPTPEVIEARRQGLLRRNAAIRAAKGQ